MCNPPVDPFAPCCRDSFTLGRETCSAGMSPKSRVLPIASTKVKAQTVKINLDLPEVRQSLWTSHAEKVDAPPSQKQSGGASKHREHETFAKKLPNDSATAGAKGGPNRNFTAARRCARQEQICDVTAGDQKHERHRTKQDHQSGTHFAN